MDTELLVDERIEDGKKLVEQLTRRGFPVRVAFWLKTDEESPWGFFLVSPNLGPANSVEPYRILYSCLDDLAPIGITPSDINLVDESNGLASAAIALRNRYPSRILTPYHGKKLGDQPIEEAYIYPVIDSARMSFRVTYLRQGPTPDWTAETEPGQVYKNLDLTGPISYSTAFWNGEQGNPENQFAMVTVLLEVDPQFANDDPLKNTVLRSELTHQAGKMADAMFKARHPDAIIHHTEAA